MLKKLLLSTITAIFCIANIFAQGLDFTASPTSGTAPLLVTFTNTSTNPNAYKYIWYFGDGNIVTDYNTTTITHIYNVAGNYNPQFDAYDISDSLLGSVLIGSSGNITVQSALSVTAASSDVYCNGAADGTAYATANGGIAPYSYSWSPGLQNTQNISGLSPGTYIVTVTDYSFSQASDTIVINEPPPLSLSLTTVNLSCNGLYNGSITAIATGGKPNGGTPGYTYGWTPYVGVDSTVNNLQPGNYSVLITDANGCKDSATTTITEPTAISVVINGATTVCSGTNTNLTSVGSSGGTGAYTYLWTPGNLSSNNINVTPTSTTTYSLNITDANGCVALATQTVTVNPLPPVVANASTTTVCAGDPVTLTGSGAISYTWLGGVTDGISFIPPTSTSYIVTGTDTNSCTASDTVFVVVNSSPTANGGLNQSACIGNTVDFIGSSAGGTTYFWNLGDGNTSAILNPSHIYNSSGNYLVTFAATANGCSTTDSILITVIPSTGIYGHVSYSSGNVSLGKVIIYLQNTLLYDSVQVATLDANGIFNSPPLNPGNYLLKAFADTSYNTLTPTYNGNVWDWNIATVIVHDCSMTDTAIITMVEITPLAPGPGSIGGLIQEGTGFGRQEGDPIPGLDVKLGKNPGGQIIASTQTDGSGYYFFGDLALNSVVGGSYIVYADIPGLGMTSSYDVILDPTNPDYDSLNYAVDSTSIYPVSSSTVGIGNTAFEKENKFKIFPNPFKGNTTIEYSVSAETDVRLEVYNVLGVKIKSMINSKQSAGNHKCFLNNQSNQLNSGVYFITLTIDGKESTQRIVVME
ncbi:MAG: hypothetical protein A3F72_11355 [Bacteroidetes bacterium RIFCSPLOWO2_12_FULL_35_15]|nr:MAG: hypothetical protein A3F72_11355 [Bacteroidetes bacterium RIFCSPLOWO2_12_FULL_35_15]